MKTKKEEIKILLAGQGYLARQEEALAVAGALSRNGGMRTLLLEGPPGCGKTALAEALAKGLGSSYFYSLLHSWSSPEDLFRGVDVTEAVRGNADGVEEPGVLAMAARASQEGQVVLCLDELDKANSRVEALLLDFLQSGRVPQASGQLLQARCGNILVFITSNGTRSLHEALLRRCRRVKMSPLPEETERSLVARQGIARGVARLLVRAANAVRKLGLSTPSLQEIVSCGHDLSVCESLADVQVTLVAWLCKEAEEQATATSLASQIWGEVHRQA